MAAQVRVTTPTREDYIREIYKIQERSPGAVRLVDLAGSLGLSKPAVTERIAGLARAGLVTHEPYRGADLTPRGRALGRRLTYKHRVIESFLVGVLGIGRERMHREAHRLEHACSDEVIEAMRRLVPDATHCPEGDPIPALDRGRGGRGDGGGRR